MPDAGENGGTDKTGMRADKEGQIPVPASIPPPPIPPSSQEKEAAAEAAQDEVEDKKNATEEDTGSDADSGEKEAGGGFSLGKLKETMRRFLKLGRNDVRLKKRAKVKTEKEDLLKENLELMETMTLTDQVSVKIFLDPETSWRRRRGSSQRRSRAFLRIIPPYSARWTMSSWFPSITIFEGSS